VVEIINNTSEHIDGVGLPPELMKKHGADILLCKGLDSRAINLCRKLGIDVYVYQAETAKDIFGLWQNKKIKKAIAEDAREEYKM